jgi:GNAT superfamily N-acetyltransferase
VLRRLIARNQRSWMEAVAGATGGSAGADWVYQPRPHGELLVPFPEQPPGADGIYDVFVTEGRRRRGLGTALSNAASAKAAALGVETMALNAEFAPLYESLGYRSLGTGRTWWLHLSDRRSSAAAPDRPS